MSWLSTASNSLTRNRATRRSPDKLNKAPRNIENTDETTNSTTSIATLWFSSSCECDFDMVLIIFPNSVGTIICDADDTNRQTMAAASRYLSGQASASTRRKLAPCCSSKSTYSLCSCSGCEFSMINTPSITEQTMPTHIAMRTVAFPSWSPWAAANFAALNTAHEPKTAAAEERASVLLGRSKRSRATMSSRRSASIMTSKMELFHW
mmetsp:Transcript_7585/g.12253  ORF Transcript_7585/g.12253 Transcript_7585/m.12253 type:complete len:208 (+) Transcript_7585:44-667(+)